jgi:hypothetical protein
MPEQRNGRPEISRFYYVDHVDKCDLCGMRIDVSERVGLLADGGGYACSECCKEES